MTLFRIGSRSRVRPARMIVAIPARNEADDIAACLRSVALATRECDVHVEVVVAADSCCDDTIDVARSTPMDGVGVSLIEGEWASAGSARANAVALGLYRSGSPSPQVWIANTDADCQVPDDWCRRQIDLAEHFDAVSGIVEIDPERTDPSVYEAFRDSYQLGVDSHQHVHGANFGVRADAYLASGGWAMGVRVGEDHLLWNSLNAAGYRLRQDPALRVRTSARTRSRVIGGFATGLALLER